MSPAEVEAVLGRPDGFERAGDFVGYQYADRLISGWSWDRADYYAIFENERLVRWGSGHVRQGTGPEFGTLVVIPLQSWIDPRDRSRPPTAWRPQARPVDGAIMAPPQWAARANRGSTRSAR
jgi:hypothetical protein